MYNWGMERTVPSTASEEIDLYLRTIYSLLRTTAEVQIRTLEEVHAGMNSSLHPLARSAAPDASAFIYGLLRLPDCLPRVRLVLLGQNLDVFATHGFARVENWQPVTARARRRRCFFNGADTLACYIASRSDIDDIIPVLTAYQIEWNKLNRRLQNIPLEMIDSAARDPATRSSLADALEMPVEDLERLRAIWSSDFSTRLAEIRASRCALRVRLLSGSLNEYWRSTHTWWRNIERAVPDLLQHPVYFISSNPHSVTNLLSGFALQRRGELLAELETQPEDSLRAEWADIRTRQVPSSEENFLYYLLKKVQSSTAGAALTRAQAACEQALGFRRIPSVHTFDVETQVIELSRLDPATIDPRLAPECDDCFSFLARSDAFILNLDYPLGLAAYNLLVKVAEQVQRVLGVYIMGKAASLNGVRGDVMIPNVVFDEHSQNTYLFQNALSAADVAPYLIYGTVLDNQKAVSVLGTFLQNARVMDVVYREGYTDIEMEAGPYLSAVYEMVRPKRHPYNEIVNLYGAPFDVGILHYVSDTPLSKGRNLGAGALSYFGMDSTYASSIAILRRIFKVEQARVGGK